MRLKDLLFFRNEHFFNGAVQADWFYDTARVRQVAESYIFHGPKYFGVSEGDVATSKHTLIDTISFAEMVANKLYKDKDSKRFILTIAGYGSGKSHLSVALASLFSGHDKELKLDVLNRIKTVDENLSNQIDDTIQGNNLVIVLNGMNDFNLNSEVLKCAKKALIMHGINTSVLDDMTKAYKTAEHFVISTFELLFERFRFYAKDNVKYNMVGKDDLKRMLLSKIEEDAGAFEIINNVYREMNGAYIRWDDSITAGEILSRLNKVLCEEQKIYNGILILFDEFGRFIEYASAHPSVAGESALQQIFEAIQNANGNILFVGLIQSDLSAYLARVDKSSNIIRYVGRYEASDKYYLSSNFETVLANLISRKDEELYERIIEHKIDNSYGNYHRKLFENNKRWLKQTEKRAVWTDSELYNKVILKGAYPIHPLTVWILSNLSAWMQQRSSLTFVEEMFNSLSNNTIQDDKLDYIFPIEIVESRIFHELINAEEKGIQHSQHCILYRDILTKYEDKLHDNAIKILQGILIINIGRFSIFNKEDTYTALRYCTGLSEDKIQANIITLENELGIIQYDQTVNRFDFIAEGNGLNEFKREFIKNRIRLANENYIDSLDEEILRDLGLDKNVEVPFSIEKRISSQEWQYAKKIVGVGNFTEAYANGLLMELTQSTDSEKPRGLVIWLYCNSKSYDGLDTIIDIIKKRELHKQPILFLLINDSEEEIKAGLLDRLALKSFTSSDRQRFDRFIKAYNKAATNKVLQAFTNLANQKYFITSSGVEKSEKRLQSICSETFDGIYNKAVPFVFDGFEKKVNTNAKKYFSVICSRLVDGSITNSQVYYGLGPDVQNRIKSVLGITARDSWKIINDNLEVSEPQNTILKGIYDEVKTQLADGNLKRGTILFRKYLFEPWGFNIYSLALFISYFILKNNNNLNIYFEGKKIKSSELASKVFDDRKMSLDTILKLEYQMAEGSRIDKFIELCNKIQTNLYVENCEDFNRQLELLLSEEEIPAELEPRIASARLKLNEGLRLQKSLYDSLYEAKLTLGEITQSRFNLGKAVRLIAIVNKEEGKIDIDSLYDYQYHINYINECKRIISAIDSAISLNINKYFDTINIDITQLSQFKNANKKNAEQLRENHRDKFAEIIECRLIKIEEDVILRNKYEKTLINFEQEMTFFGNIERKSYAELNSSLTKLYDWHQYFMHIEDFKDEVKKIYIERIEKAINQVNSKLTSIKSEINDLETNVENCFCESELLGLKRKITSMLEQGLPNEIVFSLEEKLELINKYESLFGGISIEKTLRIELINKLDELREIFESTALNNIVIRKNEAIMSRLQEFEQNWINQYLQTIKEKLNRMTATECFTWRDRVSVLPPYLSEETVTIYKEMDKQVLERTSELKIDGVISLFNQLDSEDKKKCMQLLNTRYNE